MNQPKISSKTSIKPFGDDYALGNGSDIEFILSRDGLIELRKQIDDIIGPDDKLEKLNIKLDILTEKVEFALNHPLIQMKVQPLSDLNINGEWCSKPFNPKADIERLLNRRDE